MVGMRVKQRVAAAIAAVTLLAGCSPHGWGPVVDGVRGPAPRPALGARALGASSAEKLPATTRMLAANMCYRVDARLRLFLDELDADIVQADPGKPFDPSDRTAYAIGVRHAHARLEPAALEALLNTYVFGDAQAPLKELKVGMRNGQITLAGKLKKGVWLPFELVGDVAATEDGRVRMTPTEVRSMGVRVDDLMRLVGLDLARLLKARQEKGVVIEGNHILLDPAKMFPAPKLMGPVAGVKLVNGLVDLVLRDGAARPLPALPVKAPNWIALWGGSVRVNATVAHDARVQLVDAHPADPFVFALDFYREALQGGFVVAGLDGRMAAYLPDANAWGPDFKRFMPALPMVAIQQPASDMPPLP